MRRLAPGVLAVSAMLSAACGDDGVQTPSDGGRDSAPEVRCDPTKPFEAPVVITELATAKSENSARLYDDERTLTFARRNVSNNLNDLFIATRPDRDSAFDQPIPLTTVNSASNDAWAMQTPDGLTLYFESDRSAAVSTVRPWVARRAAVADPWGPPAVVADLAVGDLRLFVTSATSVYLVSSARGGAGGTELFRADIDASGVIGTPVLLTGTLNTVEAEDAPTLTPDELTIYFRRGTTTVDMTDPMNPITTVEFDIWGATRGSTSEDFGPPALVENLSRPGVIETPSWISPDGCALYAAADAMDGTDGDLVVAKRPL